MIEILALECGNYPSKSLISLRRLLCGICGGYIANVLMLLRQLRGSYVRQLPPYPPEGAARLLRGVLHLLSFRRAVLPEPGNSFERVADFRRYRMTIEDIGAGPTIRELTRSHLRSRRQLFAKIVQLRGPT